MVGDVRPDLGEASSVRVIPFRPGTAGVKHIPGGALVRARLGAVPVLSETVADFHFLVPNGFIEADEMGLRRSLPAAHDDQISA